MKNIFFVNIFSILNPLSHGKIFLPLARSLGVRSSNLAEMAASKTSAPFTKAPGVIRAAKTILILTTMLLKRKRWQKRNVIIKKMKNMIPTNSTEDWFRLTREINRGGSGRLAQRVRVPLPPTPASNNPLYAFKSNN